MISLIFKAFLSLASTAAGVTLCVIAVSVANTYPQTANSLTTTFSIVGGALIISAAIIQGSIR